MNNWFKPIVCTNINKTRTLNKYYITFPKKQISQAPEKSVFLSINKFIW